MKSVFVTGASSGIGYAICGELIQAGFRVFGSVRRIEDAKNLQDTLGVNFVPIQMDVKNRDEILQAVQTVTEALNGECLQALINNAGIAVFGPVLYIEETQFLEQFEINVHGVFRVTKAFLPLLGADRTRRGEPGRIINMSSVSGHYGRPFLGAYAASKHALEGFSKSLRQELQRFGIQVVMISPGVIRTPIWEKFDLNAEWLNKQGEYADGILKIKQMAEKSIERGMSPDVVARVVLDVLRHKNPKYNYPVVRNRWRDWHLPLMLPKKWIDRIIARTLK